MARDPERQIKQPQKREVLLRFEVAQAWDAMARAAGMDPDLYWSSRVALLVGQECPAEIYDRLFPQGTYEREAS